jgi:hypothetical protein
MPSWKATKWVLLTQVSKAAAAFQCKQNPKRHNFTGIQSGLWMFWSISHGIVNPAEKLGDKIYCGHGVSPLADGLVTFSLERSMTFCN